MLQYCSDDSKRRKRDLVSRKKRKISDPSLAVATPELWPLIQKMEAQKAANIQRARAGQNQKRLSSDTPQQSENESDEKELQHIRNYLKHRLSELVEKHRGKPKSESIAGSAEESHDKDSQNEEDGKVMRKLLDIFGDEFDLNRSN